MAGLLSWAAASAQGQFVTNRGPFNFSFYGSDESNGYLTGEAGWSSAQIEAAVDAASVWSAGIANTPGRPVAVHFFWNELGTEGGAENILGGSASYRVADGLTIWNLGEYVWKEGADPGFTQFGFDTIIQYDLTAAGLAWNFSAAAPGASEIDFRSVVVHEIGHSLGFDTSYDPDYDDFGWLDNNRRYQGITAWDKFLVDSQGNRPASGTTGDPGDFNQTGNPVYFNGPRATNSYGGPVPVYAPTSWAGGSSLVHLDEATFPNALMSPFIAAGQMVRAPTNLEWQVMADMGWQIVPEPTATVMLLLVGGGFWFRRRLALRRVCGGRI